MGLLLVIAITLAVISDDDGPQPPAYLPVGFLIASVEDMAHYAIAQLNDGHYGTATLLSPQGIAELHRGQVEIGVDYAMGWVNNPESGIVWHNGDDGRNHAIIMLAPDQLQAVVLLANVSSLDLSIAVDDMAAGVLALLNGEPLPPPSPDRSRLKTLYWIGY